MACNCIKDFGFNIAYDTCKKIVYQDATVWVDTPSEYEISITTPVNNTAITLPIPTTGVLIITSINLGISTELVNLPSGIYCVEVTNCNGDKIKKDFINLCSYECQLANLLAVMDFSECCKNKEQELKEYNDIRLMIEGAKAKFDCDWCSKDEIKKLLRLIDKKLTQLNCNCNG